MHSVWFAVLHHSSFPSNAFFKILCLTVSVCSKLRLMYICNFVNCKLCFKIAIPYAYIAKGIAERPYFGDYRGGVICHL